VGKDGDHIKVINIKIVNIVAMLDSRFKRDCSVRE